LSDPEYGYPLIHNKVTSPHYVTPTLRRERLLQWLNGVSGCRAVVIAADAGYGKTTLLWQWEREAPFPCYWYKLDRNDRDWSLHISYLIETIKQRHPEFGHRARSMLEQLGGPGSSRPGVAAYLLAEMYERLTEPCTFIVDDWQFVASVTEVRGLWNQILRDAPPTCRFVFLSRARPRLQFARFKTHNGYAEMRTDALRFTDVEIDELFRDIYNDPLDPLELTELERRTEGWAASLQLVEVSLRERQDPEDRRAFIESITATSEADLVEYLGQEVLDQQSAEVRNFLLSTAVLRQIHPVLAARLAGMSDGSAVLERLENGGLFTNRTGSGMPGTYRYHGLFRDFLLRRLAVERTEGEIAALHIHAASYFETNALWPEAIHHYMAARLQPQAARLIAKYGEDLVSYGRLPLLEAWLGELPGRSVTDSARLSLLAGEVAGVGGNWTNALAALNRSRAFFAKKGDRRMEALACSKLSTVYNNLGDVARCTAVAQEGLDLVPPDAYATRIRLRGNVAVTTTWLASLEAATLECRRLAEESTTRGYEQFAAIAHHNLGVMLRYAGQLEESLASLTMAEAYWDASPTNPFADGSELVQTLLALGEVSRASAIAEAAVERTRPWIKPHCEAQFGVAAVLAQKGEHRRSAEILRALVDSHGEAMGPVAEKVVALLVECLYLEGGGSSQMRGMRKVLDEVDGDPRLEPSTSVAKAMAAHREGSCHGECSRAGRVLARWKSNGAAYAAFAGELPLAILSIDHDPAKGIARINRLTREADASALQRQFTWWLRRLEPHVRKSLDILNGPDLLLRLLGIDPVFWLEPACQLLPALEIIDRRQVLEAISEHADEHTAALLRSTDGADVQELRRELVQRFAQPLLIRTFGTLAIQRGSWSDVEIPIGRRRTRLLLGLLAANLKSGLTRDQVLDNLWPDADPAAAVNSLNQTVFQLRRLIEPEYREGDHPQYLISTVDVVQLNRDLVTTDLAEIRRLRQAFAEPRDAAGRGAIAREIVDFVRGEYLADLKYEDWVATAQLSVHAEVRGALLPIAQGSSIGPTDDCALEAGCALAAIDPFDETAHVAMIRHLAATGRRIQARSLAGAFSRRLKRELDEEPSDELRLAASLVGADIGLITVD
jgi:DNA-binding SARP family transcriptional activator/tetratricopeptide (TPR) repeat protein